MASETKTDTNSTVAVANEKTISPDHDSAIVEPMDELFTKEEEKSLLRKVDTFILPLMCVTMGLQYLDKQSLSYTAVFGLTTDLHLTPHEYSWCGSIFYVGQLVSEYPFIYLMSRFHLSKLVGITVIIWGCICMCLAAPSNFAGFAAVRFLLGAAEGAVTPAFISITSIWYTKNQHATRVAIWITMNGVAQIVGCLLMYGIAKNSSLGLEPWRIMFLICGALTAATGVVFYLFMPSGPKDAWFLTEREKRVLTLRMAKNREGGDKTSFSVAQLKETLLDVKAWFAFWFGVCVTLNSAVLTFASLVIKDYLGYDSFNTILYTTPSGAVQIAMLWLGVLACYLFPRQRTIIAMILVIPPLVANCLLLKLSEDAHWGIIVAAWLASCITAPWSILLSLIASNIKGNTKRSITNVMFFIGYCAGCIASPQLWTHPPAYTSGVITDIVIWVLLFVLIFTYRILCQRSNRKRDAAMLEYNHDYTSIPLDKDGQPKADLTDKDDKEFRYSY